MSSSYNGHDVYYDVSKFKFEHSFLYHVPVENKKILCEYLKRTAFCHRTYLPCELYKASFTHLAGASNVIGTVTGKENCGIKNSIHDYLTEITHILSVGRPHECWFSFIRVGRSH